MIINLIMGNVYKMRRSKEIMEKEEYDFIIVGAGVSGLAAAMYGGRLGMKTLCFGASHGSEMPIGGVVTTTNSMENYPGFIKITGRELAEKVKEHALSYDKVKIKEEKVEKVEKTKSRFAVKTNKGEYSGKTILFATGTKLRRLEIPGAKEFENKGVAYCAICDGPLYKNKVVGVIGGSDAAVKNALLLAEYAKKVYIIYRGENIHPEPINMERIKANKKIEIINKTNIVEVKGDRAVRSVVLDRDYKGEKELALDGIFVAIGHVAISELAEKLGVKLNEKKEIIINYKTAETNVKGIYAAGDITDNYFKQAITGVAEGCTAAYSAFEYLGKI